MARSRGAIVMAGLCVFLALPPLSSAQWQNFGAPGGCAVTALAASGGRLFAGTDFGVYVSADEGGSWTRAGEVGSLLLGQSKIYRLYPSGTDLFAVASGGLFRSMDGGAVWTAIGAGLPEANRVASFLDTGSALYCGLSYGGLYISTDRGGHWLAIGTGLPEETGISGLAALGPTLFAASDHVYQSVDAGATWTPADPPLPEGIDTVEFAVCGRTLLVADSYRGIYALDERRTFWTKIDADWDTDEYVNFFESSGQALLAQIGSNVRLSLDGGADWRPIAGLSASDPGDVSGFAVCGSALFVNVLDAGLFRSTDLGASWTPVETGFPSEARVQCITKLGADLFTVVRDWDRDDRLFRRSEGSSGWDPLETPSPKETWIHCLTAAGGNLIAGTSDGLFLSSDNGQSWSATGPASAELIEETDAGPMKYRFPYGVNCFASEGARVFAGTDEGIILTEDQGRTWRKVFPASLTRVTILSFARIGESFFAGGRKGLLVSKDRGRTWKPVVTGLSPITRVTALVTDGQVLMAAVYPWPEEKGKATEEDNDLVESLYPGYAILVSEDEGRSWRTAVKGLPDKFRVGLLAAGPFGFIASLEDVYTKAGRHSFGLFLSTDGGATWTEDWPGRWRAMPFNEFLFEKDAILAATEGAGIWRLPLGALKKTQK